jgi:hypothetical protein
MSHDQDWRLQLDLDEAVDLERMIGRVRGADGFEQDERSCLGDEVVLTHDGRTFFAYAMSEQAVRQAREATEAVLCRDGLTGTMRLSHWDEGAHQWLQTDPPITELPPEREEGHSHPGRSPRSRSSDGHETRAVACTIGKLIRKPFEQRMLSYAGELGLQCEIVEHPHLLSTQVAFNVTGSRSNVDAFAEYLRSEAKATTRLDPGLVPFGL